MTAFLLTAVVVLACFVVVLVVLWLGLVLLAGCTGALRRWLTRKMR
jgi:hypothetical protein